MGDLPSVSGAVLSTDIDGNLVVILDDDVACENPAVFALVSIADNALGLGLVLPVTVNGADITIGTSATLSTALLTVLGLAGIIAPVDININLLITCCRSA